MPYSLGVHKDLKLVVTSYFGDVTEMDLRAALAEITTHPDHLFGMRELINLSGVASTNLDFRQLFSLGGWIDRTYGQGGTITEHHLLAPTDLGYGMARIYTSLMEANVPHLKVHLHRTEQDLLSVLSITASTLAECLRRF